MNKRFSSSLLWLVFTALMISAIGLGPLLYRNDGKLEQEEIDQCFNSNALLISAPLSNIIRWHHRLLKLNETTYQIDFFGPFGIKRESYQVTLPADASYQKTRETDKRFTCEGTLYPIGT